MSGSPLNKKALEHLAELARLKLEPKEEEKLLGDLAKILDHFKELQELDTGGVVPMMGGTLLVNAFRKDDERAGTNRGAGADAFPESHNGFLKIPPVFE